MQQVGKAMIHAVTKGYGKNILEIGDIRELAEACLMLSFSAKIFYKDAFVYVLFCAPSDL
jgi:hypothetical protein